MDQTPSFEPVMEPKPGVAGWFEVWKQALTKPNAQTFTDLSESPAASTKTAYLWVFIAGTVSGIAQALVQGIYSAMGTTPTIPGLEEYMPSTTGSGDVGTVLITVLVSLCLSPVAGGLTVLFFAIGTALMQWIAKLFGGTGNYDKLLYALAAITAPVTLISSVIVLFSAIPFVGLCFGIVSFGFGLYALVLQVLAVQGVNRFGLGQAIGSVFIPGFVVFIFVCCIIFGLSMVFAPLMSGMNFAP